MVKKDKIIDIIENRIIDMRRDRNDYDAKAIELHKQIKEIEIMLEVIKGRYLK